MRFWCWERGGNVKEGNLIERGSVSGGVDKNRMQSQNSPKCHRSIVYLMSLNTNKLGDVVRKDRVKHLTKQLSTKIEE